MKPAQTRRDRIKDLIARLSVQEDAIHDRWIEAEDPLVRRELARRNGILAKRFVKLSRAASRRRTPR